jgi:hypothetical protein
MIPFDSNGAFCPRGGSHELRRLAVRGAAATLSASGLALGAQVISMVTLAQLMMPADFGVVAMPASWSSGRIDTTSKSSSIGRRQL